MGNPIAESTERLLADMDPDARASAEREIAEHSVRPAGFELTLSEEINLAKAVKVLAAVDGLSREELGGLKFLMIMSALPYEVQRHVIEFETEGVSIEHTSELVPAGSRKAGYLLSGATTVAAIDGLSEEEERSALELGERLQLERKLVDVLIAEARATGTAMAKGDQELVEQLKQLRGALFALVVPA